MAGAGREGANAMVPAFVVCGNRSVAPAGGPAGAAASSGSVPESSARGGAWLSRTAAGRRASSWLGFVRTGKAADGRVI